jgi:hypothetical protein
LVVLEHVEIFERNLTARVGLPGRGCIGSQIFAKDDDVLLHAVARFVVENKRAAAKLQVSRALCYVRKNFL